MREGSGLPLGQPSLKRHIRLLAKHPRAHTAAKALLRLGPSPAQWIPALHTLVTAQKNLVTAVEQAAKEQQALILQEWMYARHKHVMENKPYQSLKWLSTKQRPKGEVHSVWASPSAHPECVRYGCIPHEDTTVSCERCEAPLYASALSKDIGKAFRQHYQSQFRHRPPLPVV